MIGFTMIWAFIVGALITSKAYRYDDFSFVTSRLSAHLANIGYMVIVSSLGGLTAFLERKEQTLKKLAHEFVLEAYRLSVSEKEMVDMIKEMNEQIKGES